MKIIFSLIFVCLVIFQTNQRFLTQDGMAVFPVDKCPRNWSEVEDASKRLNCSRYDYFGREIYHCIPLNNLSQLVEFCYDKYLMRIEEEYCLVLRYGYLDVIDCRNFTVGCPQTSFLSNRMFEYPDCLQLNTAKRCFLADPSCTIDGGWTIFSYVWTQCTVTCGGGIQSGQEQRTCTNPRPRKGGKPCEGSSYGHKASRSCNIHPCPVNGNWSEFTYGNWGICSVTCGTGVQNRNKTRICNNPKPQYGGKCIGTSITIEKRICELCPCPVHGAWSEWSDCSATCGGGVQMSVRRSTCTNIEIQNGGKQCTGSKEDTVERECNTQICPVHGKWSSFVPHGDWSQCSSSCNNGTKRRGRIRYCSEPAPLYGGKACAGQSMSEETMACNTQPCSVPGGWSNYGPYSEWTQCSSTCEGNQERTRFRTCNNPTPQYGGEDCVGLGTLRKERRCNTKSCAVDGQWSSFIPFGDWSQCSSSCNNGTKTRVKIRTCSAPAPSSGGKQCIGQSMSTEIMSCNMQPCSEREYQAQTTTIIIAFMSSILILFLLGCLLIFFYRRYKRTSRTESLPQPQPEVYEEIHSMDITNNAYVPSYAEYILNPQLLNRPNPATARPSIFMNIQRFGSALIPTTNDCRLSEIIRLRENDEINEEIILSLKNDFESSEQDESKFAISSRNAFGKKKDNQEEYFDVANPITEELPVEGYENPMLKCRNSYITVLPDAEESAIKDQQDYLDCCHDIGEAEKTEVN